MDCGKAKGLLTEHIDGQLPGGEQEALEAHLDACEDCAAVFRGLTEASAVMKSARRFRAPEGFALRVMERVLDEEQGLWSWLWSMPGYMKLAQAAAAVAVVFAGVYSAGLLSGRFAVVGAPDNIEASLMASVGEEYLDAVPPESMADMYLSTEENGNEKQVP